MFSGARGQQRSVVEVERIDAADLDTGDVVVAAGRVSVTAAAGTDAVAGAAERRRRVGRLAWSGALLPQQGARDTAVTAASGRRRA